MNETFKTIINAYIEIFKDKSKTFKNFKKEIKEMLKLSDSSDKITVDDKITKVSQEALDNQPETNPESPKMPSETIASKIVSEQSSETENINN